MKTANAENFQNTWISIPGDTISDILEERNMTIDDLALRMGYSNKQIQNLISGRVELTMSDAKNLEKTIGGSRSFWLNREHQYRQDLERLYGPSSEFEGKHWLSELPVNDMIQLGWILPLSNSLNKVSECLRFFGLSSIEAWRNTYNNSNDLAAFRTSATFKSDTGAVAAWLRQGEIKAQTMYCAEWDHKLFETSLSEIRKLTRKQDPNEFIPLLQSICASCGVAVVIVRAPRGCKASGATRFISSKKASIQLSLRYLSDDHFWFTFFHEAGHLLLHSDETVFIEGLESCHEKEELEANIFASNSLIPQEAQAELRTLRADMKKVMRFAKNIGISPGIVVGQMQHLGLIERKHLNRLKVRYEWEAYSG